MKVINWIIKAVKWIKEIFDLVKWGLAIFAIITSLGWIQSCNKKNNQIDNVTTILTGKVEQIKTESGKNAAKAQNWELKYKNLDKYTKNLEYESKGEISRFKTELLEATQTIAELEIKQKNVQNYIKNELVSRDSLNTNIIFFGESCKFELEPIEQEFLSLRFKQSDTYDLMGIDYESRNTVYTIIDREAENKKHAILKNNIGNKHLLFPEFGALWGWEYFTISYAKDSCSTIENVVSIEFLR